MKNLMTVLGALCLVLGANVAVAAEQPPVPYLDWDAERQQMTNAVCTTYEVMESSSSGMYLDVGTTYVVTGEVAVARCRKTGSSGAETAPPQMQDRGGGGIMRPNSGINETMKRDL